MKWALIIIGIAGAHDVVSGANNRAVTSLESVEFDTKRMCEDAALNIISTVAAPIETVCVQSAEEQRTNG